MLDHTAYPYLIDDIVSFAPAPSLLALRGTSKAFQDRVDALVLQHAVLEFRADGNGPSMPHGGGTACLVPLGPRVEPVRASASRPQLKPVLWMPEAVVALDLWTIVSTDKYPVGWDAPSPASFTALHTIRRAGRALGRDTRLRARTVVDYASHPVPKGCLDIPPSCESYVLHLNWREGTGLDLFTGPHIEARKGVKVDRYKLKKATIVLWPHGEAGVPQTLTMNGNVNLLAIAGIVDNASMLRRYLRRGATLTLVGLEKVYRWHVDPEERSTARGPDTFEVFKANLRMGFPTQAEFDAVVANIRSITLDEWYAELGEVRRKVEGQWPVALCPGCGNVSCALGGHER